MTRHVTLISVGLVLFLLVSSLFVVEQRQQALVLQFGEVVRVIQEPGLKFKLPFIQKVNLFDSRILNLSADEKEVIAKDQKRLIVTAFAKYRITNPLKFYQTVRDESGIRTRLNSILDSSLRQVLGEVPLATLLTGERATIMRSITDLVSTQAASFGIEVIDVRIMRADLPKENSDAIYRRMQTEREKEAKQFRAEGAEEASRIKARADKETRVILAEAQQQAQVTRGEGDAIAGKIFADAFSQDAEFFSFYRSLQTYRATMQKGNTSFVLSPNSPFLHYFNNPEGKE